MRSGIKRHVMSYKEKWSRGEYTEKELMGFSEKRQIFRYYIGERCLENRREENFYPLTVTEAAELHRK